MKPDQERVRHLLTDTVTLLCKNGLQYQKELRVQGLLGITLDDSDVFVVHINEKFGDLIGGAISLQADDDESGKLSLVDSGCDSSRDGRVAAKRSKFKHRHRSNDGPSEQSLDGASCEEQTLHRPMKRLTSNPDFVGSQVKKSVERISDDVPESTGNSQMPVDVKVKVESEDDVMIIEDKDNYDFCDPSASNIVHNTDATYPGFSLNEIQSNYQHFEEILGIADASADPGGGDAGSKGQIKQDPYSQSCNTSVSDLPLGPGGQYVTGVMRNTSGVQDSMNSTWDSSQMSLHSTGYTPDGQSMLSSAPGCSTWDASQSAAASRQAISGTEQGAESMPIARVWPGKRKGKTSTHYSREYRARLKRNPEVWRQWRNRQTMHVRRSRMNRTEAKIQSDREKNRMRSLEYRQKKKEMQESESVKLAIQQHYYRHFQK